MNSSERKSLLRLDLHGTEYDAVAASVNTEINIRFYRSRGF
jgi:hypothetical protein